jgi:hypothetical protein
MLYAIRLQMLEPGPERCWRSSLGVSRRGPKGVFGRCSGNNGVNEVWPEASPFDQQNVCSTKCAESPIYHKKSGAAWCHPACCQGVDRSHADVGANALAAPLGTRRAILSDVPSIDTPVLPILPQIASIVPDISLIRLEVAPITPPILSIMGDIPAIAPEIPSVLAQIQADLACIPAVAPQITPVLSDLPPILTQILAILRNLATWRTALREREATAERDRQGNQSSKRSSMYDHLSSLWSEQPALVMASRGYSVDRS